jgi:hypothetical protein
LPGRFASAPTGVDASPSTIQGWLDQHLHPPERLTSPAEVEHFRAVGQYMGQGHAANVATLQLAHDGHPTTRLRAVLRDLGESLTVELDGSVDAADALLAALGEKPEVAPMWQSWVRAAAQVGPPLTGDAR